MIFGLTIKITYMYLVRMMKGLSAMIHPKIYLTVKKLDKRKLFLTFRCFGISSAHDFVLPSRGLTAGSNVTGKIPRSSRGMTKFFLEAKRGISLNKHCARFMRSLTAFEMTEISHATERQNASTNILQVQNSPKYQTPWDISWKINITKLYL